MIADNQQSWDMHLCQSLAAIRFNISESSKFMLYYLLYNRDEVMPVDNILQPIRKYLVEDFHQAALQEQHRAFVQVRNYLKKAKKCQAKYADKNAKEVELKVGDQVYCQNKRGNGKLGQNWKPYYRIIEKTGLISFIIKNQLDGTTSRVYAGDLMFGKCSWLDSFQKWKL